jgi:hypothetical protein
MIAVESFKKFYLKDYIALVILSLIWFGASYLSDVFMGPQESYVLSLLVLMFFMSYAVHLVRKAGSATLFYVLCAALTYGFNDLGITGMNKFYSFLVAGFFFELMFIILKVELHNVQIDIILGTALSAASIPVMTALLLSPTVAISMISSVGNLVLLSFFVGIVGSIISFLIWYRMKTFEWVLRYEYGH